MSPAREERARGAGALSLFFIDLIIA